MADPPQPPIAPLDPTPLAPADLRIEALEAMIRGLGARIEQMTLPSHSPPSIPPPLNISPSPHGIPSPLIPIRNRRFDRVLAVDTYRLRDRSPVLRAEQVSSLTSYANQIRPRLADCVFNGNSPLQVLPFLKQIVRISDQSFLSEAVLLWVVDDFLQTPVREAFRAQSFDSWPVAVYWLLTTYAPETSLESAVRRLQVAGQQSEESVRKYGQRLQMEAAALGSLMTQAEVKSLFAQGLLDPVRSLFAANQPITEFDDGTPLSILVARAELLESGTRIVSSPSLPRSARPQIQRSPILSVPIDSDYSAALPDPPAEVLALAAGNPKVSSENWTCFVCYKQGHGWLECPWLSQVPEVDKEDALLRRRKYLERYRFSPTTGRPTSPGPRYAGSRPSSPMRQTYESSGKLYDSHGPTALRSTFPNSLDKRPQSENGQASPHQ